MRKRVNRWIGTYPEGFPAHVRSLAARGGHFKLTKSAASQLRSVGADATHLRCALADCSFKILSDGRGGWDCIAVGRADDSLVLRVMLQPSWDPREIIVLSVEVFS